VIKKTPKIAFVKAHLFSVFLIKKWSRGESNSRPNVPLPGFLHA